MSSINDTDIANFAIEIKKRDSKDNFLQNFIDNNGFILWNDAQKIKKTKGLLAILPFAIENKNEINGFIIARQDPKDKTITFNVFNKNLLAQYSFDENSKTLDAQKVQTIINHFNYQKFNITNYKLADVRQIPIDIRTKFPDKITR